jgi:hypothetical protein
MGGEKLEEMDKGWEMIFELDWEEMNGEPKVRGHEVDRRVRKIYMGVEQSVTREQYRGVTPRGVDYYSWEDTLTIVVSRSLSAGGHEVRADIRELLSLGEKREERVRTDSEEMIARDSEDQDQTVTHSPEMHPVPSGRTPIYTQIEKEDANYEFRSRHEQFMMHLDHKFYAYPTAALKDTTIQ